MEPSSIIPADATPHINNNITTKKYDGQSIPLS